jgi:hypothetical protein
MIRTGLLAVGGLPKRLVSVTGSRARRAYRDNPDSDIEAAAAAIDREKTALAGMTGGTAETLDLWSGATTHSRSRSGACRRATPMSTRQLE